MGAQKIVAKARRLRDAARGWRASAPVTSSTLANARRAGGERRSVGRNLIEDATFANLKRHFSEGQIMELVYTIGLWAMYGMIVALDLECNNQTAAGMIEVAALIRNIMSAEVPPLPQRINYKRIIRR
jgi:hypothetical protein